MPVWEVVCSRQKNNNAILRVSDPSDLCSLPLDVLEESPLFSPSVFEGSNVFISSAKFNGFVCFQDISGRRVLRYQVCFAAWVRNHL